MAVTVTPWRHNCLSARRSACVLAASTHDMVDDGGGAIAACAVVDHHRGSLARQGQGDPRPIPLPAAPVAAATLPAHEDRRAFPADAPRGLLAVQSCSGHLDFSRTSSSSRVMHRDSTHSPVKEISRLHQPRSAEPCTLYSLFRAPSALRVVAAVTAPAIGLAGPCRVYSMCSQTGPSHPLPLRVDAEPCAEQGNRMLNSG